MRKASLGQRIGGALLDVLVVSPVTGYCAWRAWDTGSEAWSWLSLGVVALYQILLTAEWGKTVGKHLVGCRVVMDRDEPEPCTWTGSAIRYGVLVGPGLVPVVGGLLGFGVIVWALVGIATDHLGRGIHDVAGSTRVIDVREGGPLPDRYRANLQASRPLRPRRKRRRAAP